jgi:hypothetical protein
MPSLGYRGQNLGITDIRIGASAFTPDPKVFPNLTLVPRRSQQSIFLVTVPGWGVQGDSIGQP